VGVCVCRAAAHWGKKGVANVASSPAELSDSLPSITLPTWPIEKRKRKKLKY
jgi:hypothetical protein